MTLKIAATKSLSSPDLENYRGPAGDRVMIQIKMRGPQTATQIGERLGTTGENARQLLMKLADDGLVTAEAVAGGVGRPKQVWSLTDAAQARFPDTHSELTVGLIRSVRDLFGQDGLDRLIEAREAETRSAYRDAMAGADGIEDRLARLVELRSREGYMAEWSVPVDGDGWVLIENHCPICAAAAVCQGFCRSELAVFREALGDGVTVERENHILAGARRCAYRVRATK
jgi:predicted ArsR family transcriptional regulator